MTTQRLFLTSLAELHGFTRFSAEMYTPTPGLSMHFLDLGVKTVKTRHFLRKHGKTVKTRHFRKVLLLRSLVLSLLHDTPNMDTGMSAWLLVLKPKEAW